MVTVHDILAGAVLAGIAGIAVYQNLAEGDGSQGLLIRVLGGEEPERDAAPPPPPGTAPGPVSTVIRSVTPTSTPTSGGGGGGAPGSGGSLPDRSGEILVPRSLDPRDRTPTGTGSGAQLTT